MITQASRLHVRLQMAALGANAAAFVALALLAPGVLLLEPEVATAALVESAWTYPIVLGLSAIATAFRMRAVGPALALLEQDLVDLPTADEGLVRRLNELSLSWVMQLVLQAIAVATLTLIPQLRPSLIDWETQAAIVLLTATVTAAVSLPLYVVARAMIATAIETLPWRVVEDVIRDGERLDDVGFAPRKRRIFGSRARGLVQGRLLYAVALPVGLVAFGAALIAHAHVRAFETRARRDDAYTLARGVLEIESYYGERGREAAIAAAKEHGFEVMISKGDGSAQESGSTPGEGGVRTLRAKLDDGTAVVRFSPTTDRSAPTWAYILAVSLAIAIAALVGRFIGASVARDLRLATREVRLLGTQEILRGITRVAAPARYEPVAALGLGIDEVAERFREFARGKQRVIDVRESAQRMRDLFLASMSHDLRSPLNGILGFVTLLQKGALTGAQQESLSIIDRRGRELLELIENILDAAKIEAGRLELSRDWTSPTELLAQIVRRGRELAEEKKPASKPELTPAEGAEVDVVGELHPGIAPMFVDGPRLAQAIINIVANAVKFVDRGLVRVRVAHGHPAAGRPGLKIEVEDSGRGIQEKDLAQIFDAFRQPIRSRRHGGLGLGLSMTRAIAELHGGTIDVSSTPEHGSIFTIWIPLPSPASVERVSQSSADRRGLLRMPTPVGPGRPEILDPPARYRPRADTTGRAQVNEMEVPTVQMPALDIPSREEQLLDSPSAAALKAARKYLRTVDGDDRLKGDDPDTVKR